MLFGSDPEFFLSYQEDGKDFVIPPIYLRKYFGLTPIDESNPKHPIFIETKDGVKIHQDGVAFEFMIPPVKESADLKFYIEQGLNELSNLGNKFGLTLFTKPTINFDVKRFYEKEDEKFKECVIFGCDPDEDIFDYINPHSHTFGVLDHPYRYGGGHLHISGDSFIKEYPFPAVKLMAILVGNLCVTQSLFPDLEKLRSFYYGKPGKFRIQNYSNGDTGIEYRTPSNSWLTLPVNLMENVFEYSRKAIDILHHPKLAKEIIDVFEQKTISAITKHNKNLSQEILNDLR